MKKIVGILACVPLLFCIIYGAGIIAQLIYNYAEWEAAGNMLGSGVSPPLPSTSLSDCFQAVFLWPYGLYGLGVCAAGIFVLVVMVMKMGHGESEEYDRDRNIVYSNKGTYGTAGFMTEGEMKNVLELRKDFRHSLTILGELEGKQVCVPEDSLMNRNVAVYGASGSMKSRAYARNMIFQCVRRGESLIISDPKSELFEDTYLFLKNQGYIVKVFNLVNPENSDSWNCLMEIEGQELMAQLFADVIIKNTGSEKGDHFWDNGEMNLAKALILYVERTFPEGHRFMGAAYDLITTNSEKELNALFDVLPVGHPAKAPYSIFKQASDSVRTGIIIGLGSRLQVFQNKMIRTITQYDEINLTLPGQKKCAYFCITSDQDTSLDFLSSLFFSFLFIKLVRFADKHGTGGKLPVPVHILADELCNIGAISDLHKKLSTIRSRAISISCICQNLPQLQNRYPNNQWQEIVGNSDVQLFLGCTDALTAEYISDRTGEITIGVESKAKQLNTWRVSNYTPEYRETKSTGRRKLMTPDEVLRFPINKALIIIRGEKVLKVDKFDYSKHPDAKKLKPFKASKYIPAWAKNETQPETTSNLPKVKTPNKKKAAEKQNVVPVEKKPSALPVTKTKEDNLKTPEYIQDEIVLTDKESIMSD